MRANEIINENWLQIAKAINMLRNAKKFQHLPDETIEKMAHKVVDKWNNPVAKSTPKKKPSTVSNLTKQYKKDKDELSDEDFKSFYGFSRPKGKKVTEEEILAGLTAYTAHADLVSKDNS